MVAEARIEITKCRQLCYLAACMMDLKGAKAARKYIAMIKVAAPRMALHVIDEAIQVRVRCTLCVCCVYIVYGVRSVCSSMQCVQVSRTTQYLVRFTLCVSVCMLGVAHNSVPQVPHMGGSLLLPYTGPCTMYAVCMLCIHCVRQYRIWGAPSYFPSPIPPPHHHPLSSSSSSSASMPGPRGTRRVAGFTAGENMDRTPHDASSRRS